MGNYIRMDITLRIDKESCIKCGKCVAVCPSQIFSRPKKGSAVEINFIESCILCGQCVAVLFICTPKGSRMGAADANLAYQNGSLMAESLGVAQFYTGFVLNAANMKKQKLEKMLGIDGQINAGMALGMPLFRFKNYIDRKEIEVTEI